MVTVNLKGGLGNQLFQYAVGRSLAHKNADRLALDLTGLVRAQDKGDMYRKYALGAFSIKTSTATASEAERAKNPYGLISKVWRAFSSKVLRQQHIGWEPNVFRKRGDVYLDGYWQSPKYFADIRDYLLEEIVLTSPLSSAANAFNSKIMSSEAVFIHIRRGDYVTDKKVRAINGTCSPDYYTRAILRTKERISNPAWFVFSDDIAWVKTNLNLPVEATFVSDKSITDTEELALMASCKHAIIANSTFSWWGAWLIQNPEKVVIAPSPWFDTKYDHHADLIPDSWTRLPKN